MQEWDIEIWGDGRKVPGSVLQVTSYPSYVVGEQLHIIVDIISDKFLIVLVGCAGLYRNNKKKAKNSERLLHIIHAWLT